MDVKDRGTEKTLVRISRFLTARSTVIVLLILVSAVLLWASVMPQRGVGNAEAPGWVDGLPGPLRHLVNLLGLDYVLGTWWFVLLVSFFWFSLAISSREQFIMARTRVRRVPAAMVPADSIPVPIPFSALEEAVTKAGFRPAGKFGTVHRYVKYRIGCWGNFLLHLGLVTVVLFSIVYILTQDRVHVRLVAQEISRFAPGEVQELRGILPTRRNFPYSIVLKTVEPRFWPNDKLESLASELYITDEPGGNPRRVDVALSDKAWHGNYLVYQLNNFGIAFDLTLAMPSGEVRRQRLFIPYPDRRDVAGYGNAPVSGTDYTLKGKFFADRSRDSMNLASPQFSLRIYQGQTLQGEIAIEPGERKIMGSYAVRLDLVEWWTDILLVGTHGMAGIFTGFGLILAGVLCSYCLVPREIVVRESEGRLWVQNVTPRFGPLYKEEFSDIIARAKEKT